MFGLVDRKFGKQREWGKCRRPFEGISGAETVFCCCGDDAVLVEEALELYQEMKENETRFIRRAAGR